MSFWGKILATLLGLSVSALIIVLLRFVLIDTNKVAIKNTGNPIAITSNNVVVPPPPMVITSLPPDLSKPLIERSITLDVVTKADAVVTEPVAAAPTPAPTPTAPVAVKDAPKKPSVTTSLKDTKKALPKKNVEVKVARPLSVKIKKWFDGIFDSLR